MTDGATFEDAANARWYAQAHGFDFDNQDDWCDICKAYHVGVDHDEFVPPSQQCGSISLQGFNTVLECKRRTNHPPDYHDNGISQWSVKDNDG